ncbi:MAG: PilZ domain-containing protein [Spirochaetales bacterium]|nr:PilZ domain-containing protein [Spirochaetales bacterium]
MITRQYARISADIKVNCNEEIKSIARDISEGGMKIITSEDFPMGSYISLQFAMTPDHFISTHGKVIWKRNLDNGYKLTGLQFWGLSVQDQAKIRDYIISQIQSSQSTTQAG